MIVFWIDPARAGKAAPHHRQRSAYCRRDLNSGEQAGHENLRTADGYDPGGELFYGCMPGDSQ
jgi:hypothetical protein